MDCLTQETRPRAEDASRVPRRADPAAEYDLAEVSPRDRIQPRDTMGILIAPATPITVTIGPSVAVAIVGPVVVIAITVVTAIMSPGVSVIVGNLFNCRVRDSGTIQCERGHGGVGRAGTRK